MNETKNETANLKPFERDYRIYAEWRDRTNEVRDIAERWGLTRQRIGQIVNKFNGENPVRATS